MVILMAWRGTVVARTGVAAVLHCVISVSTQVALYICCSINMVILMYWRGTVVDPVLIHWSCCSLALCYQCQYASCFIHMLPCYHGHIDGLAWKCGSSSADALALLQSCAGPSVWTHELLYTSAAMFVSMAWSRNVLAPVPMHWSCSSFALGHRYEHTGWFVHLLPCCHVYIRDLVRNCSTSSADALELLQSCTLYIFCHGHIEDGLVWNCGSSSDETLELLQCCAGSSIWVHKLPYTYVHVDGLAYTFVAMSILVFWCGTGVAPVLMLQSCTGPSMWVHKLLCASVVILPFLCWWIDVELW